MSLTVQRLNHGLAVLCLLISSAIADEHSHVVSLQLSCIFVVMEWSIESSAQYAACPVSCTMKGGGL